MNRISTHACLGLVLGLAGIAPAHAQEQAAPGEAAVAAGNDIIVTARRKEETLQSVPIAVTALGGESLAKAAAVNLSDAVKLAPSLTIGSSSRGSSVPFVSIRGIATSDITPTIDPSVGIYVNEVVAGRPNGVLTSLYDVASVQVLRGPQGTLFGRNTTGGAVLITTHQVDDKLGGYFRGSVGNYAYTMAEAALNLPISDAIGLRLAGRINKRDGFVESLYSGQKLSDLDDQSMRVTLRLRPGAGIENTTTFTYFHSDTAGQGTASFGLFPVGAFTSNGFVAANNNIADDGNRAAVAHSAAVSAANFYQNMQDFQHDFNETYDIANTTKFEVSDHLAFKNIFGWRKVTSSSQFDYDASEAKVLQVDTAGTIRQVSEELQALGKLGKLDYVAGFYYFKEWGNQVGPSYTATPYARRLNPPLQGYSEADIRNTSYSTYLNLSYPITDTLKATLGGRYTWDKRYAQLHNRNLNFNPDGTPNLANPFTCTISAITAFTPSGRGGLPEYTVAPANPCTGTYTTDSAEPTWSFDLSWKASPDLMVYAAHRHGYHSGAVNARAAFVNGPVSDIAKPEFINDVEIGTKYAFRLGEVRGHLNLAGYYGWLKDVQRSTSSAAYINPLGGAPAASPRLLSSTVNAAKAKIYGIEIEYGLSYQGFDLSGFYAYNHTEYDQYFDGVRDHSSDRFIYAPVHTFGATARYGVHPGNGPTEVALQLNYYHTSDFATTYGQQPVGAIVPGYGLLNGRLEFNSIAGTPVDLAVFANNLTKEKYSTGGSAVGQLGVAALAQGMPRMYGVEAHVAF